MMSQAPSPCLDPHLPPDHPYEQVTCPDALSAALLESLAFASMEQQVLQVRAEGEGTQGLADEAVPRAALTRRAVDKAVATAVANVNTMWGAAR
jgi:hypothetical protein